MHEGRMNRPEHGERDRAMNSSLVQRVVRVVRVVREMNYASRRVVELQAPWIN
jgi:hypothetical protein